MQPSNLSPLTEEQIEQLNQPLDPRRVKHRPGGGGSQLSYLEGHDAINKANQIFGFGCWGFDLLGVEFNNVSDEKGVVIGGYYAARVKLTVAGCVPITEEGVCAYTPGRNPRATIDSHDMARKGAITDALKRALRCYGDQFGNSLYNNGLVDGQPRNTANNTNANQRPTRPTPTGVVTQPEPARRPGAATPTPTHAPASVPARPQAAADQTGVGGNSATTIAPATPQQIAGIKRVSQAKRLSESDLQSYIVQTLGEGVTLDQLSHTQAGELIAGLQRVS